MTMISGTPPASPTSRSDLETSPARKRARIDGESDKSLTNSIPTPNPSQVSSKTDSKSIFASLPLQSGVTAGTGQARNDDASSTVLPRNWTVAGGYPPLQEATPELIKNLNEAAAVFHDAFVAPFVPENTKNSIFREAEGRFFSETVQNEFEQARLHMLTEQPDKTPASVTIDLMNEYETRYNDGKNTSALALNSHDLSLLAFSKYMEVNDDNHVGVVMAGSQPVGVEESSGDEGVSLGPIIATDSAHCFVFIGDFDEERDLVASLQQFEDLADDDEFLDLAVLDLYNREVFEVRELQNKLTALSNPEDRVSVDSMRLLATPYTYR